MEHGGFVVGELGVLSIWEPNHGPYWRIAMKSLALAAGVVLFVIGVGVAWNHPNHTATYLCWGIGGLAVAGASRLLPESKET